MTERASAITFKGDPMTLVGEELKPGAKAPDFTLVGQDLSEIKLGDFAGKVLVLSVVPSVDTSVCATQTKTFNDKAKDISGEIVVLTVSRDLPFALKRFCDAEGVNAIQAASDYKHQNFAEAYGAYIKELGLATRAVFVIGKDGNVKYVQYVKEVTEEPDYQSALDAAATAV